MARLHMPGRLETDRLVLRRRETADATTFRQLWLERDPRVPPQRRVGPDDRPTVEDHATAIRADRDGPQDGLRTVVRRDGDVIGYCGLLSDGRGPDGEPELAYELVHRAWGAGYATEAARAVVAWADGAGYPRLWAGAWAWNLASLNVLHKLGFVETGQIETDSGYGETVVTARTLPGDPTWVAGPDPADRHDASGCGDGAATSELTGLLARRHASVRRGTGRGRA